ncbi:hypothetical protein WJX79_003849 [Trebouxia sp. C0005]
MQLLQCPHRQVCASFLARPPLQRSPAYIGHNYSDLPARRSFLRSGLHQAPSGKFLVQSHVLHNVCCRAQAASPEPVSTTAAAAPVPNIAVLDKLIAVFSAKTPTEWRKLIAHSKQWPQLAGGVLSRLQDKSDSEHDLEKRAQLRKLQRRLQSVHEELQAHNKTLSLFQNTQDVEWEGVVARHRLQLTSEFFDHVENLIHASHQDKQQREDLINLATCLIALVQAYDAVTADQEALNMAADKFQDLLKVGSLQEMDAKLDSMAQSGALDPALLLTIAKAHSSVKDTDYTREEVKDVMAHLYFKAKETLAQQQPPEVRILKHLLRIQSPQERQTALQDAFAPGPDLQTGEQDLLSTTPEVLMQTIEAVLRAYEAQAGSRGMRNGTGALTRVSISYLATYSKYGPPPQHLKPTIGMQHDAASLLWYHILSGPSARESIAAAGAVPACILIVSNPDSTPLDRTCALGILHGLAQDDQQRDAIFRSKCPQGRTVYDVILARHGCYTKDATVQAIGLLRQLSESNPRDSLKAEMGEAGLLQAVLRLIQTLTNRQAVQACLECLEELLGLPANQQQAAQAGAIPLLLDLVGHPPQHIIDLEAPVTYPRTFTFSPPSKLSDNGRNLSQQSNRDMEASIAKAKQAAAEEVPFGQCTTALGWSRHSQDLGVQSAAAACLACLTHQPVLCMAANRRAALQRLAAVFMRVMKPPQESPGSKKGKKSKGLALTAVQETALLAITGALRFLTLLDVNKLRLQQLGAVPALVTLATKASRALLRYNAQSILSNLAQLQETAAALEAAGSPSELAPPGGLMRLHPDDVEELHIEDIALTCSSVVRAKQAQAWQKLQLLQLRRAVHDMAAVNTSHSLALDRLVDGLTGNNVGKVHGKSCSEPVGLDPFRSVDRLGSDSGRQAALGMSAMAPVMSDFKRSSWILKRAVGWQQICFWDAEGWDPLYSSDCAKNALADSLQWLLLELQKLEAPSLSIRIQGSTVAEAPLLPNAEWSMCLVES